MIQGMLGENYDVSTLSRNEIIRTLESLRQIAKETESRRAPIVTTKEKKEKKEEVEEPEKPVEKHWWQKGQYE